MPAALRLSMRSSDDCPTYMTSYAISVGAGEAGSGQWEEEEEDGSGILVKASSMD
jgi:hypothetical protein